MDTTSTVAAQVRLEERGRFTNETTSLAVKPVTRPVLESELAPQLRYDLLWGHGLSHFVAIYAPRFIVPDTSNIDTLRLSSPTADEVNAAFQNNTTPPQQFGAFHNLALGLELEAKRTHWSIFQFAGYGPISNTALLVQKPWNGEGLPASPYPIIPTLGASSFNLLFLQSQASVTIRLSRTTTLTPLVNFGAFGGADSVSRGKIPLNYGPGARVSLDVKTTPLDTWRTAVGTGYTFPALFAESLTGSPTIRVELDEQYEHRWSPLATSAVSVGAEVAQNPTFGARLYPKGEASTTYGWDHRTSETRFALIGKLGPWINLLSGDVEQKTEGLFGVSHRINKTTLRAQASAGGIVGNTDVISKYVLATGQIGAAYQLTRHISIDLGVRGTSQLSTTAQRRFDTQQLMIFGGITLATDPPLRL